MRKDTRELCGVLLSPKKRKILLALLDGPKDLRALCKRGNSTTQSTLNKINSLISEGIVERLGRGEYELTQYGKIFASGLESFFKFMEMLEAQKEFWLAHRADALPKPLLQKLILLPDLRTLTSEIDPFETEALITDLFKGAEKNLIGISPVVTPKWAKTVSEIASHGVKVSLIINEDVLRKISGEEYKHFQLFSNPNIELLISEEIKFGFASNGRTIAMALCDHEKLDIQRLLVANSLPSARLGEELFEYYKKKSKQINQVTA